LLGQRSKKTEALLACAHDVKMMAAPDRIAAPTDSPIERVVLVASFNQFEMI
jgi:hypothetical protein